MLEVDKTNENDGVLITTNDEEAVENVRIDLEKDRIINHIMVNKHITALYDDWHIGIITWYKTKLDEYRVVFPDKPEYYFKDNFDGVDVILEE